MMRLMIEEMADRGRGFLKAFSALIVRVRKRPGEEIIPQRSKKLRDAHILFHPGELQISEVLSKNRIQRRRVVPMSLESCHPHWSEDSYGHIPGDRRCWSIFDQHRTLRRQPSRIRLSLQTEADVVRRAGTETPYRSSYRRRSAKHGTRAS